MPVLTKEQVVEAVFELPAEQQAELIEQIRERAYPLNLTDEQKQIVLDELEAHRRDPNTSTTWPELRARLEAKL